MYNIAPIVVFWYPYPHHFSENSPNGRFYYTGNIEQNLHQIYEFPEK